MIKLSTIGYFVITFLIGYEWAPTVPNTILSVLCLLTVIRYKMRVIDNERYK